MIPLGRRYHATSHGTRIEWDAVRSTADDAQFDYEEQPIHWPYCSCCGTDLMLCDCLRSATPKPRLACSPACALRLTDREVAWAANERCGTDIPAELVEVAAGCEVCGDESIDVVILPNGDRFPYCEAHYDDVLALTREAGAFARMPV